MPECRSMWALRITGFVKLFPHSAHWCAPANSSFPAKKYPQLLHLKVYFTEIWVSFCIVICIFRWTSVLCSCVVQKSIMINMTWCHIFSEETKTLKKIGGGNCTVCFRVIMQKANNKKPCLDFMLQRLKLLIDFNVITRFMQCSLLQRYV